MSRLTMRQPTLPFAIHLHGRLVVLAPFHLLVSLSTSARLCTCLFGLRSRPRGLIFICFAQYLPKPMFVFAFEGALLAFIVNGDRFVLFALLPRRKPRTDGTVQPPYHSFKELNLTSDGYSDSLAPFGRWPGFRVFRQWHRCHFFRRGAQPYRAARFSSSRYRAPLFSS